MEWFCGSEATIVCAGLRQSGDRADRYELWRVTTAMLRAYAWLHEHGVIHGDVQPRNILIDRRGRVTLVDFGLARRHADKPIDAAVGRGGVSFFFDPEFAKTMLDGAAPGASTKAGEQYALAALLYFLVTGSHYLDFTVEKRAMLHQIIESPMISFSQRGVCDWPRAEHALQRALNKDPAERFPCVAEFCAAWQQAGAPKRIMAASSNGSAALVPIGREFIDSSSLSAALFRKQSMQAPSVSLTYGSAGLAYALSRIAVALNDAEHFAVADAWIEKALREIGDADAFHSELVGITAERVGASSLYHGRAGVHAVRALIAIERGDVATRNASLQMFLQTACQACDVVDVTLGNAGALLGCALLVESLNDSNAALLALGNDLVDRLFQSGPPEMLGIAHGLAGIVYAALAWSQVTEAPLQNAVISHLEKLASYAEPSGRGAQWKISMGSDDAEPRYHYGWCNGTAGFVFLWTLANRITRDARYAALAESAAWNVWERLSPNPSLCCGATGQAYALLNFYRYSGDAMWLRRAKRAAEAAARAWTEQSPQSTDSPDARPTSLYKGAAGIAVLSAELESPHHARMPMFELQ
jgi:serine/threonine-protein kinase